MTNRTSTNSQSQLLNTQPRRDEYDQEPFPVMQTSTPAPLQQIRTPGDSYFEESQIGGHTELPTIERHMPLQYAMRPRPMGIRRLPSYESSNRDSTLSADLRSVTGSGRRRAGTAPSRRQPLNEFSTPIEGGTFELGNRLAAHSAGLGVSLGGMEQIDEGAQTQHGQGRLSVDSDDRADAVGRRGSRRLRRASNAASNVAKSVLSRVSDDQHDEERRRLVEQRDYEPDVVDYLDAVDPEVGALTTLTNVQNALFVPDIPFLNRYINRQPTYDLSRRSTRVTPETHHEIPLSPTITRHLTRKPVPPTPLPPEVPSKSSEQAARIEKLGSSQTPEPGLTEVDAEPARRGSITSQVEDNHYAVLPHGVTLDGWTQDDVDTLDDYVRHMLHSRRSKIKQAFKAFGKYVRKPLGFFVTLYAFLITIFGLIWVLFLIGWIYVSNDDRRNYVINIIDNVLVALFAIMGDGLAPFRAIDTYHMIFIAHYHRLSWRKRKEARLPKLPDHNDLPKVGLEALPKDPETALEKAEEEDWQFSVLTPKQQAKLVHHQEKFMKSHSYYRPHETVTHHAFPLKLLIAIVSLLDCHSLLQISLGAFTWGWSYHTRPPAITATILSVSITVNITAGILISVGDKRTRKKDVLLKMSRQGLTQEAMKMVEKRKRDRGSMQGLDVVNQSIVKAEMSLKRSGTVGEQDRLAKEDAINESHTEVIKEKLMNYAQPDRSVGEIQQSRSRSRHRGEDHGEEDLREDELLGANLPSFAPGRGRPGNDSLNRQESTQTFRTARERVG